MSGGQRHYWAKNWFDPPLGYSHVHQEDSGTRQSEKCPSHNFWPVYPYSVVRANSIKYMDGMINPYETEHLSKFTNFRETIWKGTVRPSSVSNFSCSLGQGCGRPGACPTKKCREESLPKCFEKETPGLEKDLKRFPDKAREFFIQARSSSCNNDGLDLLCNDVDTNALAVWKHRRCAIQRSRCCNMKTRLGCCRQPDDCCPPPYGGCIPSRRQQINASCDKKGRPKSTIYDILSCYPYISPAHLDEDDPNKRPLEKVHAEPFNIELTGKQHDPEETFRRYKAQADERKNWGGEEEEEAPERGRQRNRKGGKKRGQRPYSDDDDRSRARKNKRDKKTTSSGKSDDSSDETVLAKKTTKNKRKSTTSSAARSGRRGQ